VDSSIGVGPAMTQDRWTAVDAYIDDAVRASDEVLESVLTAGAAAGLPAIAVSPSQGKFLHILARAIGAKRILELGTLAGYSAIWLARALPPDGKLVTVELDPAHAEVAQQSFARAGVSGVIDLRVGAALDVLRTLEAGRTAPFDFVFIDADKGNYPDYFDHAIRLCRPGALIVADNIVRDGQVIDASSADPSVIGVRLFMERVADDRRVMATALQTVGVKGYDGFAIVLVGQ
jgi:predicted O-methyltransferase YrrM